MASSNLLAVRGKEDISTIRLPYSGREIIGDEKYLSTMNRINSDLSEHLRHVYETQYTQLALLHDDGGVLIQTNIILLKNEIESYIEEIMRGKPVDKIYIRIAILQTQLHAMVDYISKKSSEEM